MFESLAIDVRFALRRLLRRRTYTALTVLTLALGVAGTAAVYGIARRLLFDPLPERAEEEVVTFWFEGAWSEQKFLAVRPMMDGFQSVAAARPADVTLRIGDAPARLLEGFAASAELFDVLGVRPALGSGFRRGDDRIGAEPVAVLSYSLWRELGARPSIVGERIELSGERRTVVGVMPEGFWFPDPGVRVWLCEPMDPQDDVGNYGIVARLPPGKRVEAMGPQLRAITRLLDERFDFLAEWDLTKNPVLTPLRERLLGKVRPALLALLVAMGVILLVACVNVAALMLGQLDTRGTEMAMRRARNGGRAGRSSRHAQPQPHRRHRRPRRPARARPRRRPGGPRAAAHLGCRPAHPQRREPPRHRSRRRRRGRRRPRPAAAADRRPGRHPAAPP